MYHKIRPLKVYNAVHCSTWTHEGYICTKPSPRSVWEHFHHHKKKHPLAAIFHSPPSSALATTNLLSVCVDFPTQGIWCKGNHTVCNLFWLFLSFSMRFSGFISTWTYISTSFSSYVWIILYWPLPVHPFISWWTLELFLFLAITNNAAKNIQVQVFGWICFPFSCICT